MNNKNRQERKFVVRKALFTFLQQSVTHTNQIDVYRYPWACISCWEKIPFQVSIKNKESETSKFFQFHSFLCCVICFELKIIVSPKQKLWGAFSKFWCWEQQEPRYLTNPAVLAGNDTFLTENITEDRKNFITQSKHMIF